MNTNTNRTKQWQEQEALSRFQLIAPLLQEDLDDRINIWRLRYSQNNSGRLSQYIRCFLHHVLCQILGCNADSIEKSF